MYLGALRAELDDSAHIDFDRQLVLLGRLSAEAEDTDRHPEVVALVETFLSRRDIASYVERQLAALHTLLAGVQSSRAMTYAEFKARNRKSAVDRPSPASEDV